MTVATNNTYERNELGDYDMGDSLGQGTFAKVRKATHQPTGRVSALKIVRPNIRPSDLVTVTKEAEVMARCKSDFVLKLRNTVRRAHNGPPLALELELASTDIYTLVESAGKFEQPLAQHYFKQLILGLEHCHARGVAHRDIKPENMLLGANGKLKISDFGLAWMSSPSRGGDGATSPSLSAVPGGASTPPCPLLCSTRTGTIQYMAPELLSQLVPANHEFDCRKLDVWSAGVSLFVLLAGFPPWTEATTKDKFWKVLLDGRFWTIISRWATFTDEAQDLLSRMLNPDPVQRLSVEQVLAHPFLNTANPLTDSEVKDIITVQRGHAHCWMEADAEQPEEEEKEVQPQLPASMVEVKNNVENVAAKDEEVVDPIDVEKEVCDDKDEDGAKLFQTISQDDTSLGTTLTLDVQSREEEAHLVAAADRHSTDGDTAISPDSGFGALAGLDGSMTGLGSTMTGLSWQVWRRKDYSGAGAENHAHTSYHGKQQVLVTPPPSPCSSGGGGGVTSATAPASSFLAVPGKRVFAPVDLNAEHQKH